MKDFRKITGSIPSNLHPYMGRCNTIVLESENVGLEPTLDEVYRMSPRDATAYRLGTPLEIQSRDCFGQFTSEERVVTQTHQYYPVEFFHP